MSGVRPSASARLASPPELSSICSDSTWSLYAAACTGVLNMRNDIDSGTVTQENSDAIVNFTVLSRTVPSHSGKQRQFNWKYRQFSPSFPVSPVANTRSQVFYQQLCARVMTVDSETRNNTKPFLCQFQRCRKRVGFVMPQQETRTS